MKSKSLILSLCLAAAFAQDYTPESPTQLKGTYRVLTLPAQSVQIGALAVVLDGNGTDCATPATPGAKQWCRWNGHSWDIVSGGGAAFPSITDNGNQVTVSKPLSVGSTVTAKSLGGARYADQFTGADIVAKINAAQADLPAAGGEIVVPPGQYTGVVTTLALTKPINLHCASPGSGVTKACLVQWATDVPGITCASTAPNTVISGLYLKGFGSALGTSDGILNTCSNLTLANLVIDGFTRDGVRTDGSSASAVLWQYTNVTAINSYGKGFNSLGSGANLGLCINCNATTNVGVGFNNTSAGSVFITPVAQLNTAGGITDAGSGTRWINPDCEASATTTLSGNNIVFEGVASSACVVTNSGGPTNKIYWKNGSATPGYNGLVLNPNPGATSPTTYGFFSGSYSNGAFSIADQTNSVNGLWWYQGSGWHFLDVVTATGYKSSDGTAGMTGSCASTATLTVKNGLITACP